MIDPTTGNRTSTTQNAVTAGGSSTSHTYAYPAAGGVRPHSVGTVTNVTGGTTTTSSYGYDASGDTTSRPGQTVTYDAMGKPATVVAGSSTQTLIHGTPIAERTTAAGVSGSVVTWLGADAQNTVGVEVNSATGVVTRRYADPFGNPRGPAVTWSDAHGYRNALDRRAQCLLESVGRSFKS